MKSDSLKLGPQNAPHRALYHALGLTEEEIKRPLVGIVSSYNEIVPGHMNIDKIVDAVKAMLEDYYSILFQVEPKSIGGGLPYDSFYYGVD